MRNRRTRIRFPVFSNFEVRVIQSRNITATGQRFGVDTSADQAAVITDPAKFPKRAVLVLGMDADEGTIAHEASHAVRAVLNFAGARTDNEVFAYHLDFLVGRIHRFLKGSAK